MNIVLYSDNVVFLKKWEEAIGKGYTVCYEFNELYDVENSIIIINSTAFEIDIKKILQKFNENLNRVIVFEQNPTLRNAKEFLKFGAKGYGNIDIKNYFIISAIETVRDGMVWLHSEFTTMLLNDSSSKAIPKKEIDLEILSRREKEVVFLLKDGLSYKEIASKLSITPRTVKAHAQHIYTKLLVKDRIALALLF